MAVLGGFGEAYRTGRGIADDINSSQFNRLAGLAVTSQGEERTSLLGQLAGLDPARGIAIGDKLQAREHSKLQKLAGAAKYVLGAVKSNNEAATQGAWRTVRPFLEELVGPEGKMVPEQWDPNMEPMLHQVIAAAGGGQQGANAKPSQQRYAEWLLSQVPEGKRAQTLGYLAGYEARPSSAAIDYQMMEINGRKVPVALDPRAVGAQTIGGGPTFGSMAGQQPAQSAPQPAMQQVQYATSDGQPIPANEQAAAQAAFAADARGESFSFSVGGPMPQAPQPTGPNPFASRTPEQEAAAVTAAEVAARERAEAEARDRYGSDSAREAQRDAAKKLPQLNEVIRLTGRISEALNDLDGAFINTGPVDQYLQRFTEDGQSLSSAADAIQNSMLALTRVPGVGSQSDLEQRVAQMKYPQLGLHPSVNRERMQDLQAFVRDLQMAYQNVISGGAPGAAIDLGGPPAAAPQQASKSGGIDDLLGKYGVR